MGGKSSSSSSGFFSSCCCCFFPNSTASSRTARRSCRCGAGSTEAEQQLTREHAALGAAAERVNWRWAARRRCCGARSRRQRRLDLLVRAATNKYGGGEGRGRRRCGWSVRWGGCGGHDDTEAGATHDGGARRRPAEGATACISPGARPTGLGGENI